MVGSRFGSLLAEVPMTNVGVKAEAIMSKNTALAKEKLVEQTLEWWERTATDAAGNLDAVPEARRVTLDEIEMLWSALEKYTEHVWKLRAQAEMWDAKVKECDEQVVALEKKVAAAEKEVEKAKAKAKEAWDVSSSLHHTNNSFLNSGYKANEAKNLAKSIRDCTLKELNAAKANRSKFLKKADAAWERHQAATNVRGAALDEVRVVTGDVYADSLQETP